MTSGYDPDRLRSRLRAIGLGLVFRVIHLPDIPNRSSAIRACSAAPDGRLAAVSGPNARGSAVEHHRTAPRSAFSTASSKSPRGRPSPTRPDR